jgi:hypothetical protein
MWCDAPDCMSIEALVNRLVKAWQNIWQETILRKLDHFGGSNTICD